MFLFSFKTTELPVSVTPIMSSLVRPKDSQSIWASLDCSARSLASSSKKIILLLIAFSVVSTDSAKENVFATRKDIKNVTSGAGVGQDGSKGYSVVIEFNDHVK